MKQLTKFETLRRLFYKLCTLLLPLNKYKVFFLSDIRESIGGNYLPLLPLLKAKGFIVKTDFKASKKTHEKRFNRLARAYHLATSGFIVLEDVHDDIIWIKLRRHQELIQLWHGAGAFKRFGYARSEIDEALAINPGYAKTTAAIVSSEMIRKDYANAFKIDISRVHATGIPRTDVFFDPDYIRGIREKYDTKYPALKGKKILLFCPTYRGRRISRAKYDSSQFDPERIYNVIGNEFIIAFKWHPAQLEVMKKKGKYLYTEDQYADYTIDLSEERDINDLLMISEFIITDYSSIIFEYELLNKPIVYYWYDLDYYKESERGFFYDLEEYLYGPVAHSFEELLEICHNINDCTYDNDRQRFRLKFMDACDGRSSERVVNTLFQVKK